MVRIGGDIPNRTFSETVRVERIKCQTELAGLVERIPTLQPVDLQAALARIEELRDAIKRKTLSLGEEYLEKLP